MTDSRAVYSRLKRHNSKLYRSGLEETNIEYLKTKNISADYERYTIEYVKPATKHKYTPDFVLPNGIIIETKGVWDAQDRQKHLLIRKQYPNLDIRFVFSRSKTRLYKGSKTTYGSFCDKHGIKYADKLIPDEWLKEKVNKTSFRVLIDKRPK